MKLKLLFVCAALTAALCLTLTACGEQQTGGATADSTEATVSATAASSTEKAAQPSASPAASSAETAASSASHAADAPGVSRVEESPVPEEKQPSSDLAVSSKASSAARDNPAYEDDKKPSFTISLTNKSTQKTYSAACSYTTEEEVTAAAAFFLPGGAYDIAVYEYTESKDKGEPLAEATYRNDIPADKRKSIHVYYTPKDKRIEVKESTSSRNQ